MPFAELVQCHIKHPTSIQRHLGDHVTASWSNNRDHHVGILARGEQAQHRPDIVIALEGAHSLQGCLRVDIQPRQVSRRRRSVLHSHEIHSVGVEASNQ
ncbi:MAG: Uncharacterised protein [Cellulomonadaceae bacterium TMED98]|nr:MAG: Uncharacterised protein [Cellulomonadaceae bacterium TMED98]